MKRLAHRRFRLFLNPLVVALFLGTALSAPRAAAQRPQPQAPPPAPPIVSRPDQTVGPLPHPKIPTPYSIGQPTDEEQLYLEYLNRMRANPTAEGQILANTTDPNVVSAYSFFSVDLTLMQYEFTTNPAVAPLAMSAKLTAAARLHSGDMFTNNYQGHTGTDGSTPEMRVSAQGYSWYEVGENVFAYSYNVFYGHAGFAVDWGMVPGGMQNPPGHRDNMLTAAFREVGMGIVDGTNGSVGPQLITQDLGEQNGATPFITGVVYYDFNSNAFYDLGEGIGGVTVSTPGSVYYAVTPDSGGYAIPITSNGTYTVTFSGSGLSTQRVVTVSGLKNFKLDYLPMYTPPIISGPNPAASNQNNTYTFTQVGGATAYQWLETTINAYTYVEGAENGLTNVTASTSAGYSVIDTDYHSAGTHSFHLAQPQLVDQTIILNPTILPTASSMLSFSKLLGAAGTAQVAKAQISKDEGASWQDVWTQAGTDGPGDSSFSVVNVSLAPYAGQFIEVRFAYVFTGGDYDPYTSAGTGFYLDGISISSASQLLGTSTNSVPSGTSFNFVPTSSNTYILQVRAQINSRTLPWGPSKTVTVGPPLPSIQIVSRPTISGSQVQVDFSVANYHSGMTFQLWKASDLSGPWTQDASATLSTLVANSKFRLATTSGTAARTFYKVKGSF
jgi:Cysteine-rich secretory protein family